MVPASVSLVGGAFCSITDDSGEESGCALLAVRTGGTGYDIVLTDEVCEGTSLVTGCIGGYRTALISQHIDEVIEDKSVFVETDIWMWDDESGKMAFSKTMEVSLSRDSGVTHLLVSEYDDLGVLVSEVEGSVDDDGASDDGSSGGAEAQGAAQDFFYGAVAAVGTMAAGAALVGAGPVSVTTVAVVAVAGGAFGAWAGSDDDEEAPPADGGGSGDCGDVGDGGGGDSGGGAEPQSESEDCNPEEPETPVDPDQDLFEDCNPEFEDCDDEGSTDDLFDDSITDDLVLSTF